MKAALLRATSTCSFDTELRLILRHTAAPRLHQAGADLKRVADILGHVSIDTTVIYIKVDLARLSAVTLP